MHYEPVISGGLIRHTVKAFTDPENWKSALSDIDHALVKAK